MSGGVFTPEQEQRLRALVREVTSGPYRAADHHLQQLGGAAQRYGDRGILDPVEDPEARVRIATHGVVARALGPLLEVVTLLAADIAAGGIKPSAETVAALNVAGLALDRLDRVERRDQEAKRRDKELREVVREELASSLLGAVGQAGGFRPIHHLAKARVALSAAIRPADPPARRTTAAEVPERETRPTPGPAPVGRAASEAPTSTPPRSEEPSVARP